MTKLNQIIAVRQGVQSRTHTAVTNLHRNVQTAALLSGLSRTYEPLDEMGDRKPPESTRVQVRTDQVLKSLAKHETELFDVSATLDWANFHAKADVVVDGQVLIADAPVTYLMWLEKRLTDLGTFFKKLPTLDPSENWSWDEANGWYRSDPVQRNATKNVRRNHVKAKATDRHAEQVEVYTEDVPVGVWTTVKFSGAIPERERATLVERVHKLQDAVKHAREQANMADVQHQHVGDKIFGYLLGS